MKLALIAYLHGAGGAERQLILLANEMAGRGHDVYLLAVAEYKAPYKIEDNIKFIDLTGVEQSKGLVLVNRCKALRHALKQIMPDVTINYNLQGAYFSLFIGHRICGKILYSERGDPYDKEYSGVLGIVRDFTCKHVDALVFQSEGARNFFRLRKKQQYVIIHNSVNVPQDEYPVATFRDNRIVSVGRLHPQKNPDLLIDAFDCVAKKFPDIRLEMYGDGILKEQLQKKVIGLGMTDRIKILPSCKDIFEKIRTARLFVLASDYEGMPNALMEAMALGLPCVSTDCRPGGARTIINNGENGLLVPVRNVDALSKAMIDLLSNPERAEKMAIKARHLGETHTNKAIFDKWDVFLRNVVGFA